MVFEPQDVVEGSFDDEAQTMLEMPPEPNVVLTLDRRDEASVAAAFRRIACMTETLAAASELIDILPGNERPHGEEG